MLFVYCGVLSLEPEMSRPQEGPADPEGACRPMADGGVEDFP